MPVRQRWAMGLILGLLVVGALVVGIYAYLKDLPEGFDTAVYQAGAAALWHGHPLYDSAVLPGEPAFAQLPFTYPPFAALLFTPLTVVPPQVAWGILSAVSALALMLVGYVVLRHIPRRPAWLSPAWGAIAIGVPLLVAEPVRVNLEYGQINAVLMALIVVDVLVLSGAAGRAGRFGGVLVGVAAATKLTPLIFVALFLLTGRRADAARAVGTFVGLQLLMLVITPHDTITFWSTSVLDSSRIPSTEWSWNQSLGGMIRRLTTMAPWSQTLAYAIGAVLAVGAAVLVRHYHRRGRPVYGLLATAFLALLVSPVSWVHHWVWILPLVAVLLAEAGCGNRLARWLLAPTLVVYGLPVLHWIPNNAGREFHWNAIEVVFGNSYVLFVVIVGMILIVARARVAPRPAAEPTQVG